MMVACAGLYILRNHLIGPSNPNETNQNHRSNKTLNEYENSVQSINTIITTRPIAILDFSSQYGSNGSDSYVVSNICSKPEIYPLYGDSTHALAFRTYGTWWINMPSYKETIKHFSRWENHFTSRDFLDIEFGKFIDQCLYVHIYETFNPGTLEVVYVGQEDEHKNITWHRVWTFPEPFTVILENNEELVIRNGRQTINDLFANSDTRSSMPYEPLIVDTTRKETWKTYTRHSRPPAARLPRIVKISLENKVPFRTRFIRLEFDHSTVDYYSEIDTVTLSGTIASSNPSISTDVPSITVPSSPSVIIEEDASSVGLTKLPFDLLFLICSYLDLRSLVRLSSTCHLLHQHCLHPLQFQSLNLQPYWNGITDYSIEHFFLHHCTQTRHLSLAWTKSIQSSSFYQLLNICSNNLVQLNLTCCQYLTEKHLKILVNVCPLIESLNLENCHSLQARDFLPLKSLNHLRLLNVYRTRIDYRTLLPLIDNNKNSLEHLNLGSCQNLGDTIGIIKLLFSRCSNLRSIDLWRISGLTSNGFLSFVGLPFDILEEKRRIFLTLSKDEQEELALLYTTVNMPMEINAIVHMQYLSEVDFGWTDPPSGFIKTFVQHVGHSLIKLFLTACRRVNNDDIIAVSEYCPRLHQLDLLGSSLINESTIELILKRCLALVFLDLSFCDKITDANITMWKCQYQICFKRSHSPRSNENVYTEFP